mgnify:CR=1 FL=1
MRPVLILAIILIGLIAGWVAQLALGRDTRNRSEAFAAGIIAARRRRSNRTWLVQHYFFMSYSYLGLVAAAIAETATRWPAVQSVAGGPTAIFWITVVVASVAVFVVGGIVVRRRAETIMRPFRAR